MNKKFPKPYKAILAFDFDLTIADTQYPALGELKKNAKEVLNKLYEEGYCIIINTCRSGVHEQGVVEYLKEKGIKYHHINENCPHLIDFYEVDCRKISADVYIDDKHLWELPSWNIIYKKINSKFNATNQN